MRSARSRQTRALLAALGLGLAASLAACTPDEAGREPPEPSSSSDRGSTTAGGSDDDDAELLAAQDRAAELAATWGDAGAVPGTGRYAVEPGRAVSDPAVPSALGVDGAATAATLTVGSTGDGEAGDGEAGDVVVQLALTAATWDTTQEQEWAEVDAVECDALVRVDQLAECGGWVLRVRSTTPGGGAAVELVAVPDGFEI
ncbi:hypothetical protein [Serinibacter arcticus]|uniref:Secreted protein n=1 Tax=Serinibacter arcticus TaxID=1655435 RepID=A0A4Z1DYE4_9MICO|nr:hypothetical protein [Serinibacter arcticus]TGO03848.1 hypothetical protein SERN_2860 [Serinibacter arcticus]